MPGKYRLVRLEHRVVDAIKSKGGKGETYNSILTRVLGLQLLEEKQEEEPFNIFSIFDNIKEELEEIKEEIAPSEESPEGEEEKKKKEHYDYFRSGFAN